MSSVAESRKLLQENTKQRNIELYGSKIKSLRIKAGMTAEDLALRLHVTTGSVRNWECGLSRPDLELLTQMFRVLHVSPDDFFGISGVGSSLSAQEQLLVDSFRLLDDMHREDVLAFMEALNSKAHLRLLKSRYEQMTVVRDMDRAAAAGAGADWPEYAEPAAVVLYAGGIVSRADEVFTVSGSSMEPQFHDGDKVLVQYCGDIQIGDIGIFYVPGFGGMIKQKAYDRLHSLNPDYDDILPYEDGAKVIGKVLGKITPDMVASPEDERLFFEAAALWGEEHGGRTK